MDRKKLTEGVDFYWVNVDEYRFKVFTEKFLLERGYCCNNTCKHCPYKEKNGKNI
jgi:hypothetical protein